MSKIAIVYHSGFGHTKVQAQAILKGAASVEGTHAELFNVEDLNQHPQTLNDFDAIVFGSPTYLGAVSAPFKAFMDSTSSIWAEQQWKNKIAAGFTNSNSLAGDKLTTLISLSIFAAQHAMIWVGQGEMNSSTEGDSGGIDAVNRTGTMLGAVAQSDNADSSITPGKGDLKTAQLLGERVAKISLRLQAE